MSEQEWVVETKGGPEQAPFEIAVVKSSNAHGRASYGWFDESKLLISHNGGPCRWGVTASVWGKLLQVAHAVAAEMNASR